jgi:endonuclease III
VSALPELARQVHQRLLDFYGQPTWRNPLSPLDELVSTILSQNTNDTNRDRAYNSLPPGCQTKRGRASSRCFAKSPPNAARSTCFF